TLSLTSAPPQIIQLPPRGAEKNYFINLSAADSIIRAHIAPGGAISADDVFAAVRRQAWPRLEIRTPLAPEIRRMVDVYQRLRPPGPDSQLLPITASDSSGACIRIPPPTAEFNPISASLAIEPSVLTSGIDFSDLAANCTAGDLPNAADWHILIRSGPRPLLAIRQSPSRQVWIGFHSPAWSATPEFVIFWTKVFDWAGHGADTYSWQPAHLPDHPAPGLFAHDTLAINAPALPLDPPPATNWQRQLQLAESVAPPGSPDASRWLLLSSILFLAISAALWPRKVESRKVQS
ncbi:MAG TPA: hypothetical protein VL992_20635, partial [Tepidisphaeraceae bacterium]|nr:hypothetical protein [Tepidisphaeraceae bacterium]